MHSLLHGVVRIESLQIDLLNGEIFDEEETRKKLSNGESLLIQN